MSSKISKICKIFEDLQDWRLTDDEQKKEEIVSELQTLAEPFLENSFMDYIENDSTFLNLFEAMMIKELEKLGFLLETLLLS